MMTVKTLNFFKRLEEWAIKLKTNKPFQWVRTKLAVLQILILMVFSTAVFLILNYGGSGSTAFGLSALYIDLALLVTVYFFLVYFSVQTSLRPIRENMEAQKRFIASASHELRTPLSIIKANCEVALLDNYNLSKEEAMDIFKENVGEINRMADILTMLLQLDKLEVASTNRQVYSKLDFASVLERTIKDAHKSAEHKNIKIHKKIVAEASIWGSEAPLRAMALNVLNNAISYTPEGGDIYVYLKYTEDYKNIEFKVVDTGVGIPKKEIPHIFNPFYRTPAAKKIGEGGHFGLGLALVDKIAKDHKGKIDVKSSEGEGSEIKITLPVSLSIYAESDDREGADILSKNLQRAKTRKSSIETKIKRSS